MEIGMGTIEWQPVKQSKSKQALVMGISSKKRHN
jgi:hypothetical protein